MTDFFPSEPGITRVAVHLGVTVDLLRPMAQDTTRFTAFVSKAMKSSGHTMKEGGGVGAVYETKVYSYKAFVCMAKKQSKKKINK